MEVSLMALTVKPIGDATTKWGTNAAAASGEYTKQAGAAGPAWETGAKAGNANYQKAITAGGVAARQLAGVTKAGATKYTNGINLKGKDRFSGGVNVSKPNYQSGAAPYFETMASLTLSARGPRGDASNYTRSKELGDANHAKRLALLGMS
jgi:hypothetical protein